MAAILKDNCDRQTLFFNFPNDYVAQESQTITPSESYVLETVKFYAIWRIADPGTCYVSIQETTAGAPNGSLVSDKVSFTVTDSKVLKSITFSTKPSLMSGTKYAIVFEAPSGVSGTKELHLYGDGAFGTHYAGGDRVWKDTGYLGSIWHTQNTQDLNFYCWGSSLPGQVTDPAPAIDASDITLHSTTGTWVSGGNTDYYRVLYGTLSGFLSEVGTTTDLSMALVEGAFSVYGRISYWRVDAVNEVGTTQGVEWVFTTMLFDPVLPTGITLNYEGEASGEPIGTATGENNMITLHKIVAVANSKIWIEDI